MRCAAATDEEGQPVALRDEGPYQRGNAAHVSEKGNLLHGEEEVVFADAGNVGVEKPDEVKHRKVTWHLAMKHGKLKAMEAGPVKELTQRAETLKARVRARVEHPFHVVKNLFRHRKVRCKGLAKNHAQLQVLFALANLVIAKKHPVA